MTSVTPQIINNTVELFMNDHGSYSLFCGHCKKVLNLGDHFCCEWVRYMTKRYLIQGV